MLECIGANLHEILQVRGSALVETEIWSLLRNISEELLKRSHHCTNESNCLQCDFVTPNKTFLLPSGEISIISETETNLVETLFSLKQENNWQTNGSFQVYSFGLTMLWCAEYGIKDSKTIKWSSTLQSLVVSMCENSDQITLEQIHRKSFSHPTANCANDNYLICQLCESILGQTFKIERLTEMLNPNSSALTCLTSSRAEDEFNKFPKPSKQYDTIKNETILKVNSVPGKQHSCSQPLRDSTHKNNIDSTHRLQQTIKQPGQHQTLVSSLKHIEIEPNGMSNCRFYIQFVDGSRASVTCGQVSILQVINSAIMAWLPGADCKLFSLAWLAECEYHFLYTFAELRNKIETSKDLKIFHLRILYYPPVVHNLEMPVLKAMHQQLCTDIIDERITCSYNEAFSVAALSLQYQFGDYKQTNPDYLKMEKYVSTHVITQLGITYVYQQVNALHRQLAGIKQKEALLLFLRRCQNMEEYGMNFHKTFRCKSCKEEAATWLGVGPLGITVFDLKRNNIRLKRHALRWQDLKKMNCKNRKLSFCLLNPDMKLRFYQTTQARSSYLLTVIGKNHQFHSSLKPTSQISSLSLFDDVINPSQPRRMSVDHLAVKEAAGLLQRKSATKQETSEITDIPTEKNAKQSNVQNDELVQPSVNAQLQLLESPQKTTEQFVRSFRTIRRPSSISLTSISSRRRAQSSTSSTPVLSDANANCFTSSDDCSSHVTRTSSKTTVVIRSQSEPFGDQVIENDTDEGNISADLIHEIAREFYQTSLSTEADIPHIFPYTAGDSNCPSTSSQEKHEMYESLDNLHGKTPDENEPCCSNSTCSFSSTGITFYNSDTSS